MLTCNSWEDLPQDRPIISVKDLTGRKCFRLFKVFPINGLIQFALNNSWNRKRRLYFPPFIDEETEDLNKSRLTRWHTAHRWHCWTLHCCLRTPVHQEPHLGQIPKSNESRLSKRYLHARPHSSTVHNGRKVDATQVSLSDEWINKMWQIHTTECYSAFKQKETPPFAKTRMNPQNIMLREVSQSQKDKHCLILLIWGI